MEGDRIIERSREEIEGCTPLDDLFGRRGADFKGIWRGTV